MIDQKQPPKWDFFRDGQSRSFPEEKENKKLWESVRKKRDSVCERECVCVRECVYVWVSASEKSCEKVALFFQKIFVKKVSNLKNSL